MDDSRAMVERIEREARRIYENDAAAHEFVEAHGPLAISGLLAPTLADCIRAVARALLPDGQDYEVAEVLCGEPFLMLGMRSTLQPRRPWREIVCGCPTP